MLRLHGAALRAATACALLVLCSGCFYFHARFVAEQKAEAAGFRLEYFKSERLLFVHRPDGTRDGVDLARLRFVLLHRMRAKDSSDGKPKYWWHFTSNERSVSAAFFGTDPLAIIAVLKHELPGFDEARASRIVSEFEHDKADSCLVWATAAHLEEQRITLDKDCQVAR